MSNSVLVRFYVAEEGNDAGFAVRGQDVHLTSQSLVGHEDLGELLPASASLDPRTELVLETTVDDARRVRQIPDVHHISQRKVGQNGRVRITVDMPESIIPEATSHSCIWSRSSLCANTGLLFYQSVEQWEELSSLLTKETWISGRVLCESPRWVLVDTSTGLHSDDVISRLKEWRVAGLISQDISYRSWHVNKEGRINLSVGLIDSGAKAEIRWTRVSRLEHVKHCCQLLAFGSIAKACRSTRFLTLRVLLRNNVSVFPKMILTDWSASGVSLRTMKR